MKSYDEMTDHVLRRRDAYAVRQRRKRIGAAAAIAAAMGCMACVIVLGQEPAPSVTGTLSAAPEPSQTVQQTQPTTQPPVEPQGEEPRLTFLAYTAQMEEAELEENVALPLAYYIGVTDIRGLTTETEIVEQMKQSSADLDAFLRQFEGEDDVQGICHRRVLRRENYIISLARCGSFRLCLDQIGDIKAVTVETSSGYGEVTVHQGVFDGSHAYDRGFCVTVDADAVKDGELMIDWGYSTALLEELEADPTVPLTDFTDTVTITVTCGDGGSLSCAIDLTINEDGTVWALLNSQQSSL